jgi:glycosyltransferase involved in cell wall biosynthesis
VVVTVSPAAAIGQLDAPMATAPQRRLKIALLGTRGLPPRYSGFETLVDQVGRRLVMLGHHVTVYCRTPLLERRGRPIEFEGMRLVHLPTVRTKTLETLLHSGVSSAHVAASALVRRGHDAAFVFNAANAPWVPFLQVTGVPVVVHVDGLEWRRSKWGPWGRRYYRWAESSVVRRADALIADAREVAAYYRSEFGATTEYIAYGAPDRSGVGDDRLAALGLEARGYHLVVARFEPENHVLTIARGYRVSTARLPLVIVGSAPYSRKYVASVEAVAASDRRIRLLGPVWDEPLLDQLFANAALYVHGHSIGGTNPSLLRAVGAAAPVAVFDSPFNREVVGDEALVFRDERSLMEVFERAEVDLDLLRDRAVVLQRGVIERFRWDDVAAEYAALAQRMVDGGSRRHESSGRRSGLR